MKLTSLINCLAIGAHTASAYVVAPDDVRDLALDGRSPQPESLPELHNVERSIDRASSEELWKRKGGGGGGGRGGGGSSSGGGSTGGGGGGGRGGLGSSSSNGGGRTTTGSGPPPSFGGGRYYGGGARQPYGPGGRSPSGIAPALIGGAALGGIFFLGAAAFAYGAYSYPYSHPYSYYNASRQQNETKPVECLCEAYSPCGCDENGDTTYLNSVIGNGSYEALNKSIVSIAPNQTTGNDTIFILGSLPNGTTAPGGDEDPYGAAGGIQALVRAVGWWPVATTVLAMVCFS